MAANQSSARKYRNGVSQMGGQVYNFVGSIISFAASLFGAGARTIGEIGNGIGIENDYK